MFIIENDNSRKLLFLDILIDKPNKSFQSTEKDFLTLSSNLKCNTYLIA